VVLAGEGGLLLLGWALSRWLDIRVTDHLHLNFPAVLWGVIASLPLFLGLRWTLHTQSPPIKRLLQLVQDQLGPLVASRSPAELALAAALAGLAEEVLFRGVMQDELARRVPGFLALVLTSATFGLAHFLTLSYALLAALAGLYLGTLYWVQGNLLIPIIAHALYDLVALMQLARMYRARPTPE
jgi:membrane protease YdiL (CAAX protease family)